jgi:hypothetical protein
VSIRVRVIALVIAALSAQAVAQPAPPPPPPPPPDNGTVVAPTEDRIRELVDRELARVLAERATAEAREREAREQTERDAAPLPDNDMGGSSGLFDTRIAFTLTNENMLVQPGQTIPSVPGWRFGVPTSLGVLFFDNYDTRYSGFETLSHVVAYRDFHKGHFEAEAAVVIRLNELTPSTINLTDDGSYLVLTNWKDARCSSAATRARECKDPTRLSLTMFPVSSDRFRLGYSYRLSWGGDPEYARAVKSAVPGAKLQYDTAKSYFYVGAKSAVVLDRRTAEDEAALAFLAGAGYDVTPMLRVEANGGYFDRGYNELVDVNDQKVQLFGASAQVALHHGMPVQSSIDYRLYKNNGEQIGKLFAPVFYPGGLSWLAMAEATTIAQTLKDPDATGKTKLQHGYAADLNVRIMLDRWRFRGDVSFRDLAFILHTQPSLPTYEDFPKDYKVGPDLFADIGFDRNWRDFLTLGVVAGIEKPATLTSPKGIAGGAVGVTGSSTAVIRNNNISTLITILPTGQDALPQLALKGTARLDFGRIYSALLELWYSYDPNVTNYLRSDPSQPFQYVLCGTTVGGMSTVTCSQLGLNATVQARF